MAEGEKDDEQELLDLGELLEPMLASLPWQKLKEIGGAQAAIRENLVSLPEHEWRKDGPSLEFLKGAVFGIRLILGTPESIVREATRTRHERQVEEQEAAQNEI
jgi:hypothetical protein